MAFSHRLASLRSVSRDVVDLSERGMHTFLPLCACVRSLQAGRKSSCGVAGVGWKQAPLPRTGGAQGGFSYTVARGGLVVNSAMEGTNSSPACHVSSQGFLRVGIGLLTASRILNISF